MDTDINWDELDPSDWLEPRRANVDLMPSLHTGGISVIVEVPRHMLSDVLSTLTNCAEHGASHVFVVDQSRADRFNGTVRVGVSEHGLACLKRTEFF